MAMKRRVLIIGGGVAGLSAALELERSALDLDLQLIEASPRLGGWIRSERRGEFLVEHGPDAALANSSSYLALLERLGLVSEMLPTREVHRGAQILRGGKLTRLPRGYRMFAPTDVGAFLASPLISPRGKARALMEPLVPHERHREDESVKSFLERRFGRELYRTASQPLVCGIYGGDGESLSARSVLSEAFGLERAGKSVLLHMMRSSRSSKAASGARYGLFMSFKQGMETLPTAMASNIRGDFGCSEAAMALEARNPGWLVTTSCRTLKADALVLAVSPQVAAGLLGETLPKVSAELAAISCRSTTALSFGFPQTALGEPLTSFGFVVPREENPLLLACTFASRKFERRAPDKHELLRVFLRGDHRGEDEEELAQRVLSALQPVLKLSGEPLFSACSFLPASMPQYVVGHHQRVHGLEQRLDGAHGLELAGNAFRGVGIPAAILSGERAAHRLASYLRAKA